MTATQTGEPMTTPQRPDALEESRRITSSGRRQRERVDEAIAAITDRMPDLIIDGQACPFALDAYLRLKGSSDRVLTPAAVRSERAKLLDRHAAA